MHMDWWGNASDNNWWKRKLAGLGYRESVRPYDLNKNIGLCIFCNKSDILFPLSGEVIVCEKCYARALDSGQHIIAERHLGLLGLLSCEVCDTAPLHVYYVIKEARACTKCFWKKLGKHKHVMKIDGERMW